MKKSKLEWLYRIEEYLLAGATGITALVLIGNVFSRLFTGHTWYFAEEVCQIMVIFSSFMGLAYAARNNKHISMSAVLDLLPEKTRDVFQYVIYITTALVCLYMGYLAVLYSIRVAELGRVTPALQIPYQINTGIVAVGLLLCGITYLEKFVKSILESMKKN